MYNSVLIVGKIKKIHSSVISPNGKTISEVIVETWKVYADRRIRQSHTCLIYGKDMYEILEALNEGDMVAVRGEVGYREWVDRDGCNRQEHVVASTRIEKFDPLDLET